MSLAANVAGNGIDLGSGQLSINAKVLTTDASKTLGAGVNLTLSGTSILDVATGRLDCSDAGGEYYFNEAVDMTATSSELNKLAGSSVTATQLDNIGNFVKNGTTPTAPTSTTGTDGVAAFGFNGGNPIVAGSMELYVNGILQNPNTANPSGAQDYSVNDSTGVVTFVSGNHPLAGSVLLAHFRDAD